MNRVRTLALAFALFPSATWAQAGPTATLRTEIQQAVRVYIEAYNKADVAAVVEIYSRQPGVTSVGDGDITRGWDRIREAFDQLIGTEGKYKISIGSIDVTPLGPGYALALTSYTIALNIQGQEVQQRGAMTLVLQKQEGEWKVIHDHTSTKAEEGAAAPGGQGAAPAPAPAPRAPVQAAAAQAPLAIADGQAVEVANASYVDYRFDLPAATCVVAGRIVGVSGGSKDFEAYILDDDNFRNWTAGGQAQAHWQSGRVVVASIPSVPVQGPGRFHLVVSNAWSILTPKTVQAQATVQC